VPHYVLLGERKALTTFECSQCGLRTHVPTDEIPAHRGKPERPMHDCPAVGGLSVPISEKFPR
jgi:hypothetical protein